MAKKRTKNKTHAKRAMPPANADDTPKSFVMRSGRVSKSVVALVQNLRKVMEPNTASKLKERRRNRLKDYVHVAGQLGVSHFLIFSQSETGTNLRVCRAPKGPTLIFRVHSYSLMKDVAAAQIRPRSPGQEYHESPLLVMNNFKGQERQMQLMTTVFQNMFPPLNVQEMKLTECRRVVLLHYDPELKRVELRHYYVNAKPVGVSKSVKRIIQTDVPDMHELQDISEYVLNNANVSESEAEDNRETVVTMTGNYVGRANQKSDHQQRAIRLTEIGPRLTLQLIKIQDGFCDGEVLHHEFIKRSPAEVSALRHERQLKLEEKQRRRAEQEQNVARKEQEREDHKKKCGSNGGEKSVRFADDKEGEEDEVDAAVSSDDEEASDDEILEEFHDEEDRFDRDHASMHEDDDQTTTDGSVRGDDGDSDADVDAAAALKKRKLELMSDAPPKKKSGGKPRKQNPKQRKTRA